MRTNGILTYILGDHLGSTSVTLDASGSLISQMKYKAWGEVRYSTNTALPDYTYTGQYSHTADFGLMFYNARWYDPALGRFAQADSIVPGGVQGLDRYAYVNNNPLRYTDPTGHVCSDPEDDSGFCEGSANVKTKVGNSMVAGNGETHYGDCGGFGQKECRTSTFGPFAPPVYGPPAPSSSAQNFTPTNPIDSYCGAISGLACAATATQDIATLIDVVGVGLIEAPAVATGCIEGGPLGCAVAEIGVAAIWTLTLNNAETIASSASLGLTITDDLFNNGGWGENSSTSLATWGAGLVPITPSWDLAVDAYSSGYNHGFFNGVDTIWTNGLFR